MFELSSNFKGFTGIQFDKVKASHAVNVMGLDIKNRIKSNFVRDNTKNKADYSTYKEMMLGRVHIDWAKRYKYPRKRRGYLWESIKVKTEKDSNNSLNNNYVIYSNNRYAKKLDRGNVSFATIPLQPNNYFRKPNYSTMSIVGSFLATKVGKNRYRPEYMFSKRTILPYNFFDKAKVQYEKSELYKRRQQELVDILVKRI